MQRMFRKIMEISGMNDKVLHLIAGFVIAAGSSLFCLPWACFSIAAGAGLAKEVYDYFTGGVSDWYDLMATIAGAMLFVGVYYLFFN